jgi:pullulanase/glycogen debranching enzyme
MSTVFIENFNMVTTNIVSSFKVEVINFRIFSSVYLRVFLYDNSNKLINSLYLTLSGDDYKNWGNDDNYLINYVANHYGFTLKPFTNDVSENVVDSSTNDDESSTN